MVNKIAILNRILKDRIVAIVRADNPEEARKTVDACLEGGIHSIEITFTVPHADKVIETLSNEYDRDTLLIGAGTVLDSETARIAIMSGAQYIVTPSLNIRTVQLCNRYQIPIMAGAMTIKEIIEAIEYGTDIVKIFPGESLGPAFLKAVKGPLPYVPMMPTGGVNLDNVIEWFKAGAVAVGVGGSLTAGAKNGDFKSVTERAKKFVEKIKTFME
ncbi:bifunctional 2-keto-4-hydroxyglutarate aldolase/2-keto-3-deoxy-6-phosphogluconate aldolase [Thermoanaerobacter wiegelii]|uniref:2-dehydro-3-deoxyphosphogluconate aldolase/4-hydroxy-2-oxoglutarate aldolase n=1 Tax=Thermoanaerobacter wiegelii Rt8.B1 TaxID=697303 RepID=G2MRV4_9THEO|nr:bifunctional 2-keto-4-hydroxyglutarate aldolase/2-keto-3-deoxy-6-phosphogluconate aldolase [Thermoanaerobacter wiegelii]AEM77700.1 2-dehydro-3-deoxyphosphogluconate aldolase/4-hydroxy-2-oxoglutarate aldolase [Thermoanaerobacter wiegelii Rt8.B1]